MVLVLIAVYASMELRGMAPNGSDLQNPLKPLHFILGLSGLALVIESYRLG